MGTTAEKLTYLNETKTQLKDMLNLGGASLTTEPFRQYVDTLKNRYLYFINNGTDVVWNNWDKVTGEGTILTLNNTEEAPMKINLKGNTSQESTTGKNKLPYTNDINETINSTKITGVKGTYTIQTTPTATVYQTYVNLVENYTIQSGDYLHIMNDVANANITFNLKCTDDTILSPTLNSLNRIFGLSSYVGKTISSIRFYVSTSYDGAKITLTPMIVNSPTTTEWEQFTFGASPNPDYPQDIHVVSGDNSIEVCGKNLAYTGWAGNFVTRINNSNYATLETFDNRNCLKWKEVAGYGDYDNKYMFKINWKENTQYTFSFDLYTTSTNNFGNICIEYTDGTITEINGAYNQWTHKIQTSTSGKTIKYLRPNWRIGYSYIDLDTFMVYEGTTATTYEPYTGESYPISLGNIELCKIGTYQDKIDKSSGKNLFDYDYISNYSNTTFSSYRYIKINGYDKNKRYLMSGIDTSNFDNLTGVTVVLFNKPNYSGLISGSSICYNSNHFSTNKKVIDTNLSTTGELYLGFYTSNSVSQAEYEKIVSKLKLVQLEEMESGDTPTEYEPYGTGWYVKKEIGKVVLNGSENWAWADTTRYTLAIDKASERNALCNYYTYVNYTGSGSTTSPSFDIGSNLTTIGFHNTALTSLTNFKNDLQAKYNNGTPVIAYYPLATPTYTEITDSTLLSQLNALAKSYNSQTNISQENNDLASILNATALREMA